MDTVVFAPSECSTRPVRARRVHIPTGPGSAGPGTVTLLNPGGHSLRGG